MDLVNKFGMARFLWLLWPLVFGLSVRAQENPVQANLDSLKESVLKSHGALQLGDYEGALEHSELVLKKVEGLKFVFMPFMERLRKSIEIQKAISESAEAFFSEPDARVEGQMTNDQTVNLAHAQALASQAKNVLDSLANNPEGGGGASPKQWELALSDIGQARLEEEKSLERILEKSYNEALRNSNTAKFHLENALERFQNENNGGQNGESQPENQGGESGSQSNADSQGQEQKERGENGETRENQRQDAENANAQDSPEGENAQELDPQEALAKLRELQDKQKRLKLQKLKESGEQARNSGRRAPVDKDW